ncbi:MAG: sugar phosphate isomerase/epimerase [Chloroflexi bacterium]|nr:sugar phosphate isomerase/epimerase [Chloroflexota bacterium]
MRISCVTASYVADVLNYPGQIDWSLATERILNTPVLDMIDDLLDRLSPARLDGIEFWYPHISPGNLTPACVSEIRKRLAMLNMTCCACAGGIGDPEEDPNAVEELFQVARLLEAPLIAGHMSEQVAPQLARLCSNYGIAVAYENALETDAAEILRIVRLGDEWVGANLDTGNLASQGGDPVQAVRELGPRIMHVHLKDVPEVGSHDCVALGEGIVDVAGVIRELRGCGYDGWLSVEVETADHDPTDDIIASVDTVRRLLGT